MKIFSSDQIALIDKATIDNQHINDYELVVRVARNLFRWIKSNFQLRNQKVKIFAGEGNNGNDAIALAALLGGKNISIELFLLSPDKKNWSPTRKQLIEELYIFGSVRMKGVSSVEDIPSIGKDEIIIDGIFGTGINRPVTGVFAEVIRTINRSSATVISIDLPGGLPAEFARENDESAVVRANFTLTLEFPKLCLFFRENHKYVGEWVVLPVGLDTTIMEELDTPYSMIDQEVVGNILKPRGKFSHKGDYGHGFLVAGSFGMGGAAVLAAKAAMRSGLGLLTVHVPQRLYHIMQVSVPEAICTVDPSDNIFTACHMESQYGYRSDSYGNDLKRFRAVAVGPGIGKAPETVEALKALLAGCDKPMVLDADAINIISSHQELLRLVPPGSVLTPHPGEFARIAGEYNDTRDGVVMQMEFSKKHNVIIVLKGANTTVSTPDGKVWFNPAGNPGMATAGSGDVLGGVILGLLTQGYPATDSAIAGVFLHSLAGDLAAAQKGEASLVAGDIVDHLGEAFVRSLKNRTIS
ncbi:MAG: NAD(P)H-hydrate dehydratase [Bacteroidia bacterium]|nr:NAD(P)H-hydrate dehydratase [Bacteroidia bacterium]